MTITLSNGATVSRHATDTDVMTGIIIDENDDEANAVTPLSIATYSIGTTVDISGNALASDLAISGFDDITPVIDTNRRQLQLTDRPYQPATKGFIINGTELDTLDWMMQTAVAIVDVTKLTGC